MNEMSFQAISNIFCNFQLERFRPTDRQNLLQRCVGAPNKRKERNGEKEADKQQHEHNQQGTNSKADEEERPNRRDTKADDKQDGDKRKKKEGKRNKEEDLEARRRNGYNSAPQKKC